MSDEIKDTNLKLLIGLKEHLDKAAQLRAVLDKLLSLVKAPPQTQATKESLDERAPSE